MSSYLLKAAEGSKTPDSRDKFPVSNSTLSFPKLNDLGQVINLSVPQFSHLVNGTIVPTSEDHWED